jgi:hypothetical protein
MPNIDYALEQEQILAGLPVSDSPFEILLLSPLRSSRGLYENYNATGDFAINGNANIGIDKVDIYILSTNGAKTKVASISRSQFTFANQNDQNSGLESKKKVFSTTVKINGNTSTTDPVKYAAFPNKANYRIQITGYDTSNIIRSDKIYENFVILDVPPAGTAPTDQANVYYKYNYSLLPLYNGTAAENHALSVNNHYSVKSVYNNYFASYETYLKRTTPDSDEKRLINFQAYVNYKTYTEQTLKTSNLFVSRSLELKSLTSPRKLPTNFNDYSSLVYKENQDSREYMKNILIASDMIKELVNYSNDEKAIFPFYNEITIKQFEKSSFVNYLEQYDLENEFLFFLYETDKTGGTGPERFIVNGSIPLIRSSSGSSASTDYVDDAYVVDLNYFMDISSAGFYKKNYINYNFTGSSNTNIQNFPYLFLTKNDFYEKTEKKKNNKFLYTILLSSLAANSIPKNSTDVAPLSQYQKNNSQVVAFQIEKYNGTNKLSNVFFLNSLDMEEFVYTDTQVKYDVPYTYNIWCYKLITFTDKQGFYRTFLVKHPLVVSATSRVTDSAPLAPSYNVFLDRNKDNRLLFLCENLIGFKREFQIPLDLEPIKKLKNYRNDDDTNLVQVFRLNTRPTSYKDFKDALQFEVKGLSFIDDVSPNKDYYYMLRSKDVHGNFSNPSYVLKVRIVEVDGTRYVESDIYADYEGADSEKNFKPWAIYDKKQIENKNTLSDISFKRYLQIYPSPTQLLVKNLSPDALKGNTADNDLDSELFGSDAAVTDSPSIISIKDKNYKLRIKSKNSGKIVDINFKFTVKK